MQPSHAIPSEVAPSNVDCQKGPIDLVHLAKQTLGNRTLERELLALFETQSTNCLAKLSELVADHSEDGNKRWRMLAHTLKGSARGIGAWHAAECAASAEEARLSSAPDASVSALSVLAIEIEHVNRFIALLLNDR